MAFAPSIRRDKLSGHLGDRKLAYMDPIPPGLKMAACAFSQVHKTIYCYREAILQSNMMPPRLDLKQWLFNLAQFHKGTDFLLSK